MDEKKTKQQSRMGTRQVNGPKYKEAETSIHNRGRN